MSSATQAQHTLFLTTAGEFKLLSKPRACRFVQRLRDRNRDDYMLVEIDPPLVGQYFGLGGKDITTLLLSTRHKGFSLFPPTSWPMDVYVARITDPGVTKVGRFMPDQVQLIAWGLVFNDLRQAEEHARELEPDLI